MKKQKLILLAALGILAFIMLYCSKSKETVKPEENQTNANGLTTESTSSTTPMSIYGAWHAGNEACGWSTVRNMTEFDTQNHWLIDRGNGQPSVNLIILSFVGA